MDLESILAKTLGIVRNAGKIIVENWRIPSSVKHKDLVDLVTETDVAVEDELARELGRLLPEARFVGEESAAPGIPDIPEELCWVVDPVDGTTNFVHRIPLVAISVALCEGARPILGVVLAPMLGECYYATAHTPALCNGDCMRVSQTADLQQSLAVTGFPYVIRPRLGAILDTLGRVLPATQGLRRFGSAAIDLAWVACGRTDIYYEAGLKPWDMAAGWLLVERAGGKITDFDGEPIKFNRSLLATNGLAHENMIKLLAS